MTIRRIGAVFAAFRTRAATLVAITALAAVGLITAGATAAYAAPNCTTAIVGQLNTLTSQAQTATSSVSGLTTTSSPQQVQTAAQNLSNQLNAISVSLSVNVTDLGDCAQLNATDAQTVATALDNAVAATQNTLSTITSKHTIFAQFGLTGPIASALRSLQGSFDSYTSTLAVLAPSQTTNITDDRAQIEQSLDNVINLYEQLCIPSPLYPIVPPICIAL